jgi:site-specific recombinase XerD
METPKLSKKLPPKLTKQESMRLLEVVYNYPYKYKYLRYRNHAIFAVFLFAGLRRKEVLGLRLVDVDVENFSIFVYQGKGSKDRIIPMSYKLASILSKYLEERKRLGKTCPEFFTSLNRNMGLTSIGMRRLIEKIKESSGINFSAHKLRHTFATLMLEGGVDIYSLSKMMGHSSIKTTTIYLAASVEHLRKEITKHPLNDI